MAHGETNIKKNSLKCLCETRCKCKREINQAMSTYEIRRECKVKFRIL
jgi:hypothetical protein